MHGATQAIADNCKIAGPVEVVSEVSPDSVNKGDQDPGVKPDLRHALTKLREKAFASLTEAEESLLRSTLDTLRGEVNTPAQAQLRILVAGMLAGLDAWRASAPPAESTPDPAPARTGVIGLGTATKDWEGKPEKVISGDALLTGGHRQQVTELAGVPVRFVARCHEVEGNVRIEGDIPDDMLLLARSGSVHVEGYVFGHVAASGPVTVTGNAAGATLVSRNGDIRAGRLLNKSVAVAPEGSVACDEINGARLVYAGETVTVGGDVSGGRVTGRAVTVTGTVSGAELHAAGPVAAGALKPGAKEPTVVCLRGWFTTGEYGCPPDDSVTALRRAMTKTQYRAAMLDAMQRYLLRDIANSQRVLLYYLAGHVEDRSTLCLLRGAHAHTALLDQAIEAGTSLHGCLDAQAAAGGQADALEVQALAGDCLAAMRRVRLGAKAIPADFYATYQEALDIVVRRLSHTAKKLCECAIPSEEFTRLRNSLGEHVARWRSERDATAENARRLLEKTGIDRKLITCIEDAGRNLTALLDQALAQATKDMAGGKPRSEAGFVRLLNETIRVHEANLSRVRQEAEVCQAEEARLRAALLGEPSFVSWERDGKVASVTADRYEPGVVVTSMSGCTEATAEDNAPSIGFQTPVTGTLTCFLHGTDIRRA
jgi:hypothetical protein